METDPCRLLTTIAVCVVLTTATTARAQPSPDPSANVARAELDALVAEEDPGWRWEEASFSMGAVSQRGHGLQSQAGPLNGRGREDMWVLQPWMQLRVRMNDQVVHELSLPVDIVSAASTDAIDVVSKASEYNEAATLDLTSTYSPNDLVDLSFRFGFHYEEPMRSFIGGPAATFKFFEENTVLGLNMVVVSDGFDPHTYLGNDRGFAARTAFSFNASIVQVLSETTLFDASFGTTEQWGTLETTWNSVIVERTPTDDDPSRFARTSERFPKARNRNAFFVRLSQMVPDSGTTAKVGYRFYVDDDFTLAHSLEGQLFQYLAPWFYLRGHARMHVQSPPRFWVASVNADDLTENLQRTSDSDLEAFIAREIGLRAVFLRERAPASVRGSDSFSLEYLRYQRDNDLVIDFATFGYRKFF